MMSFVIYSLAEILFIIAMIATLARFTKTIFCHNCGQKFGAIPKRVITIASVIVFFQMAFVNIFVNSGELSFMCYLAGITCIYYFLKKEGYKCPNCKTINQLNEKQEKNS